nr:hypothetical protein [Tanacetum cinerariifolium]
MKRPILFVYLTSEEEEEEHLASTVPVPALHSPIPAFEDSDETEPFKEGETAATPPPFGYRVAARISIMDYCQSREVHTSTLVTQIEALQRDVSTLQRQHIDDEDRLTRHIQHEHAQRDVSPEDGDRVAAAMSEAKASRVRNGYGSNGSGPRLAQTVHECTYPDFLKCQPLNFKGTEGVIGLTQWFEKTESVFNIRNCTAACQVKYAVCTLQGVALTWWNSYVKTVTLEVAQEFALMCDRTFPEESDRVEKYIGGVPDMIHDSVKAIKPKTMHEAIEFATKLMDKRIRNAVENKQKFKGTSGNNQNQPQQNKRQNTDQAYAAGNSDKNINCLKLKNNNRGNQGGNDNAQARVYMVGNAGANPDNVVV